MSANCPQTPKSLKRSRTEEGAVFSLESLACEEDRDILSDCKVLSNPPSSACPEEPMCVEDSQSNYVCLGMIVGPRAAFVSGFSLDEEGFKSLLNENLSLSLKAEPEYFALQISNLNVAVIDKRTTSTLQRIKTASGARFQIFKDDYSMSKSRIECKPPQGALVHLLVNIFGPREKVREIGTELSKARFYLQHPHSLQPSMEYENPHIFKTKHRKNNFEEVDRNKFLLSLPGPTIDLPEDRRKEAAIDHVFNSSIQSGGVHELEADIRVETKLLKHQKEALHFILQRENDGQSLSLWKRKEAGSKSYYEHGITGNRTLAVPPSTGGGLLADEMGLGKTLSMISAIVSSQKQASLHLQTPLISHSQNNLLRSKATLVVVPSAVLLDGWLAEIQCHVKERTLRVYKYHGQNRQSRPEQLLNYDVIVTTYATLSADFSKISSPLKLIKWFRIVLDEAHFIRNPSTKQYRAACSLTAQNRWCLTGTPVQNRLEDLGALLCFLKTPYLDSKDNFQMHIIAPIVSGQEDSLQNIRNLLNSICLRRRISLLKLPKARYQTQTVTLSHDERAMYTDILQRSLEDIENAISNNSSSKTYSSILRAILRTRMLCDYGTFRETTNKSRLATPAMDSEETLATLLEGDEEPSAVPQQEICQDSSSMVLDHKDHTSQDLLLPPAASTSSTGHSTKLFLLVQNIKSEDPTTKSIVFSCWKTTLDLVDPLLTAQRITFVRIDGSISTSERTNVIEKFNRDPHVKVILMTTGTGAVGLNLTIASQVHIVEPQWNPSIEIQAVGRIMRLTQEKDVTVTRYITQDTIEEAIRDRQCKKLELAELTLNKDINSKDHIKERFKHLRSILVGEKI